jgi:hypothetical protein
VLCPCRKHCCSVMPPSPMSDCGTASSTIHLCHH